MNSRKILLVAALVGGLGSLLAQSDRGTIEGTITDPSGAAVPQAQIQIIQVETNHVFDFGSNDLGVYFAANLPLGTYRVIVKKEGFHAARREPVLIQAQTRARGLHIGRRIRRRIRRCCRSSTAARPRYTYPGDRNYDQVYTRPPDDPDRREEKYHGVPAEHPGHRQSR